MARAGARSRPSRMFLLRCRISNGMFGLPVPSGSDAQARELRTVQLIFMIANVRNNAYFPSRKGGPNLNLILAGLLGMLVAAADKASDLKKNGDTYEHSLSRSTFSLPKGWQTLEAQTIGRSSLLGMRKPHPEGEGQPG